MYVHNFLFLAVKFCHDSVPLVRWHVIWQKLLLYCQIYLGIKYSIVSVKEIYFNKWYVDNFGDDMPFAFFGPAIQDI